MFPLNGNLGAIPTAIPLGAIPTIPTIPNIVAALPVNPTALAQIPAISVTPLAQIPTIEVAPAGNLNGAPSSEKTTISAERSANLGANQQSQANQPTGGSSIIDPNNNNAINDPKNDAKKKRKPYVKRACLHCKKAHAACDNSRPCRRCQRLGLECLDSDPTPRKRRKKNPNKQPNEAGAPNPDGTKMEGDPNNQQANAGLQILQSNGENSFFSLMPGAFNPQLLLQFQQSQAGLGSNAGGVQNGAENLLGQSSNLPNLFQPLIQMFNQSAAANAAANAAAITDSEHSLPFLPLNTTQNTGPANQILAIENGAADSPSSQQNGISPMGSMSPSAFLTGQGSATDSPVNAINSSENKQKADGAAKGRILKKRARDQPDAFSFNISDEEEDEEEEEEDVTDNYDEIMKGTEEENEELVTKNASNLQRENNTAVAVYEQPQEALQVYSQDVDQIGKMFQNFQIKVFQEFDSLKKKVSQIDERVSNLEKNQKKD